MPRFPPRTWTPLLAFAACAGLVLMPRLASAGPFEVQGLGPEGVAELGARVARAQDGTAAFFNPGGLGLGEGTRLSLSPMLSVSTLTAQGKAQALEEPFGFSFSASGTVPFEGPLAKRIRIGLSTYLMPTGALRLLTREADRPFYPYYDNRTQRLVILPALAARITRSLGIGIGANVLAGVRGPATLEDGATGAPEPRIDIAANTVLSAVAGLRFDPAPFARFGLTLRQSFGIPLQIETKANVGGVALATDIDSRQAMFDPLTVVLASSFDLGRASVEVDASYMRFSDWDGPFLSVRSTLPGVNLSSRLPEGLFRDIVSLRAAGEWRFEVSPRVSVIVRAGAGFEPTILKSTRQGRTNMLDGDKLLAGLGATLVWRDAIGTALRIGLGANGQFVSAYSQEKIVCQASPCPEGTVTGRDGANPSVGVENPGYPRLTGSGSLFTMSLGVGVDL